MDVEVIIEGHEQRIKTLERDMSAVQEVQAEIRSMNETLVTLTNEFNWYNSTTSRMLIYQQPLHIYKAKIPPSSGNNFAEALSRL